MAWHLTEEQKMIQAMVRDFARTEVMPTAAERDKTGEFPREIIKKMGELGLMGMNVPPEYNGAGVDTVSYSVAMQEIAYADASTAVIMSVHNSVACGPIFLFGSDYLKETYLKTLAAGQKLGCFALTEPGAGSDPASQKSKALRDGDFYIINGTKMFITSGKTPTSQLLPHTPIGTSGTEALVRLWWKRVPPGFMWGSKKKRWACALLTPQN